MAKNVCQLLRGMRNGRGIKAAAEALVSHYSLATPTNRNAQTAIANDNQLRTGREGRGQPT